VVPSAAGAIVLVRFPFSDLSRSKLQRVSYARPGKLFTASYELMTREVSVLKAEVLRQIVAAVVEVLQRALEV
jgi:hypothetical protein